MSPPGSSDGSGRARRLQLVPPPPDSIPPASGRTSSSPPSRSSSPDATPLPIRFAELDRLNELIFGRGGTRAPESGAGVAKRALTPYEFISGILVELANPNASGAYDITLQNRKISYRLVQDSNGAPLDLFVHQEVTARSGEPAASREILHLRYMPDGSFTSSESAEAHASLAGLERTHHNLLSGIVKERGERTFLGRGLYNRLRTSLEALTARYSPETQSAWYDHFAVYRGKLYSFRIGNLIGLREFEGRQRHNFIEVYEHGPTGRVNILTLAATGESLDAPEASALRNTLSHDTIEFLENLVNPIERARGNPQAYQSEVAAAMQKVDWMRELSAPTISHSVDTKTPLSSRRGTRGEPILEIRGGWDLLRNFHPWAGQRWENPDSPGEVRRLTPRARLSARMGAEMLRWGWESFKYGVFGDLRSPQPGGGDYLNLHLFPEGGGQLNLYRFNPQSNRVELFDILIGEHSGPHWRAGREIDLLAKAGSRFETRLEALQAAVARRSHPIALHVAEAPRIDLDNIFLLPDGSVRDLPESYREAGLPAGLNSAEAAWRMVRDALPADAKFVDTATTEGLSATLRSDLNRIDVHFRESTPSLHLTFLHHDRPVPDGEKVRRVEVIMRRGEDIHSRVFEDGEYRPHETRDVFRRMLMQAQQGTVRRSPLTLAAQALPRLYGYYKNNGATYALSYFGSLPFIYGYEHMIYSPGEQALIGTHMPRLSLNYFFEDFMAPFMTMSTASGVGGIAIDGVYNLAPSVASAYRSWQGGQNFFRAFRNLNPSFFNGSTATRPIGEGLFRGFLQRSVPLFLGVLALDRLHTGHWVSPTFWRNMRDVGLVSAGSSLMIRGLYASERFSGLAVRAGLIESAAAGASTRFSMTFRGGCAVALLELVALGIINAHERRELMHELENNLRSSLGNALDRRNELITRLEHGEEIRPSRLVAADQDLQQAQAMYRRFLELDERRTSAGTPEVLSLDNDFSQEYERFEAARNGLSTLSSGTALELSLVNLETSHESRLSALRYRETRIEDELRELRVRYGDTGDASASHEPTLREFLASRVQALHEGSTEGADANSAPPASASPIAVNSPQAQAILEQLRWKAAEDPGSVFWSTTRRARYIVEQFRGYRIATPNGGSRRWGVEDAVAFLNEVNRANLTATGNMEAPLTLPGERDHLDTTRLDEMLREEARIRESESLGHLHGGALGRSLAGNLPDFDRQMEAYLHLSNERMAAALERFVDPNLVASLTLPRPNSDPLATAMR